MSQRNQISFEDWKKLDQVTNNGGCHTMAIRICINGFEFVYRTDPRDPEQVMIPIPVDIPLPEESLRTLRLLSSAPDKEELYFYIKAYTVPQHVLMAGRIFIELTFGIYDASNSKEPCVLEMLFYTKEKILARVRDRREVVFF